MSDLRDKLDAIADASPPPTGAQRDREIQSAITRGMATRADIASTGRRRVWWLAIGTGLAAAAAIVVWLQLRADDAGTQIAGGGGQVGARDAGANDPSSKDPNANDPNARDPNAHDPNANDPNAARGELVVERGTDAPVGTLVEAREQTVLLAPDGTRVEANTKTRFTRETRDSTKWRLDEGQLAMRVADTTTLEITTPEARIVVVGSPAEGVRPGVRIGVVGSPAEGVRPGARIDVVGSQFVVGRYASETIVEVQVGDVLVTPTGGEPVTVHAGETWPRDRTLTDAGIAGDGANDATGSSRDGSGSARDGAGSSRDGSGSRDGVRVPVLQFDATIIRKTIRAGKVGDAREMIEAQRSAHASSKRALAELGILAAEADLAERKTKSAIGKYLDVVRDFASTPQAEQALFAAAQLAMDRPDAGYKAEALLKDYVDTYPKGQFAKDAQRLLDSLKK